MDLDLLNEMIKATQESLSKRGLERNCSVRLVLSHDVIAALKARYGMIISDPPKPFSQYMGLPFSEGKETQIIIEEEKFGKGQCYAYCEVDGVNLVSTEALQKEVYKQQAIIEFLKKELIHKTCYRQVMKRQYRELKQQKKCNCTICRFERKEISVLKYAQELGELLLRMGRENPCLKEGDESPRLN